jgi:hypothetical protein
MSFPATVLPIMVELRVGYIWTDVTSYVRRHNLLTITRGRADGASQAERSACELTLLNNDYRFSPRHPLGAWYGQIGAGTPIRVSLLTGTVGLLFTTDGDKITCPDAPALGITGDLDVRIDLEMDDWWRDCGLAAKYTATGDQRSWMLGMDAFGLYLRWSPNGTLGAAIDARSTVPVPVPVSGRLTLRATLDVNNGSGGWTVTFYTGPGLAGPWTQLGNPVTGAGVTSVYDSTSIVEVGDSIFVAVQPVAGCVYGFELRNGINGSVVANPNFTIQTPGATSFADTVGSPNTWTVQGNGQITRRRPRFAGEVTEWIPGADSTGEYVYTVVEARGPIHRLSQGAPVLASVMYRAKLFDSLMIVAYWPMEDQAAATSIAPALQHPEMTIIGSPELAIFEGFIASHPLPVLAGAELRGPIPAYTVTGETQVRWLMAVPSGGAENGQTIMLVYTTGSVRRWEVVYGTGGTLALTAYAPDGTQLATTGGVAFAVNGKLLLVSIELRQNGGNIEYALATLEPAAANGLVTNGTLNSHTVGRAGNIVISPGGGIAGTAIGHVSVQSGITTLFDLGPQLAGWAGETAGSRIQRLCREEGVTFRKIGDVADSTRLGPQRPATLMELVQEAALADGGMLYEPRDVLGIGYRMRTALYNQEPTIPLDYAAGHLMPPLEPPDGVREIRNDFTASREGGSSARAVLETGALSVLPPPAGVGRFEDSVTISVEHDLDLFDQAGWRLRLGTVDEARYPQIQVNMARTQLASDAALTARIVRAEIGDRLTIDNPPPRLPPDQISQLIQGYEETLGNFEWTINWTLLPETPYQVALYDSDRYGPSSSILAEDLTTVETAVDVSTADLTLWTTDVAEFPFDILVGGERMTVTAISGASSPQTFTVVRSVNGIVKTHLTGAIVQLARPAIYAL